MAWNSTPAVSMNQLAEAKLVAPMATHTCPVLLSNVPAGAWNFSEAVLRVSAEGTGETRVDHATPVGAGVPPL